MNRRLYRFLTLLPAMFVVAVLVGVIVAFAPTCSGSEWVSNRDALQGAVTRTEDP